MNRNKSISHESGISLVEVLIATVILAIAMAGISKVLIMTMGAQQKIDAEFRAQQDARQAEYDLEEFLGEAKRLDAATNQYPIFQSDLVSIPTQKGNWVTYYYTTPPGAYGPTIVRITTTSRPTLPLTVLSTDKQLINVMPNPNDQYTTVERNSNGTSCAGAGSSSPIFSFYLGDGSCAPFTGQSIQTPRDVRSIVVNYRITVSVGHVLQEPVNASVRVNLRNY